MMNHSCILVLLKTVKKEAKYILVAEQGEAECPYCALLHAKARTTLLQPLVLADRPSFTVFMKTSRQSSCSGRNTLTFACPPIM